VMMLNPVTLSKYLGLSSVTAMMLNLETRPQMLRLLFRTFTVDLGLRLALLALGVGRVGMHCDYSKTFISFCDSITVVVVELVYNLMIGDSVTIIS